MGRSTKKGPWVEERLMGRIVAMNDAGKKQMIKTWSRTSTVGIPAADSIRLESPTSRLS